MDLITVDVTDVGDPAPVRGDFVDLIGPECRSKPSARPRARIGYEVLTRLGRPLPSPSIVDDGD